MRADKKIAIRLRTSGKSYNEISRKLQVPKGTLSSWFRAFPHLAHIKINNINKMKVIWAGNITAYNHARAKKISLAAEQLQKDSADEIKKLSKNELKIIGAALYWAEGHKRTKWSAMFCNSDPEMVKIMMRFFREICKVPEDRFRPHVQIHPNTSVDVAEEFWSSIIKIERKYFTKPLIQVSITSKRKRPAHRLPYGTFRITIAQVKVLNKIKGWIKGLASQA